MRKSCWLSLGREGSEGVGGAVGTDEGREGSVVAMLVGLTGVWIAVVAVDIGDLRIWMVVKVSGVESWDSLWGGRRCLRGRRGFIRHARTLAHKGFNRTES